MGEFVTIAPHDDRVATVRVDRAPVNALNQQVRSDLNEAAGILSDGCLRTEDARIGMRSFLEQGPGQARFTGR